MGQNYAYVTLATTKAFLTGALFLQESLKRAKSQYPLVVIISRDLSDNDLSVFDHYQLFDKQERFSMHIDGKYTTDRWADTINKFQILFLEQYDKVMFIDADIFMFRNLDHLFEQYRESELSFKLELRGNPVSWCVAGQYFLVKPNSSMFQYILDHRTSETTDEEVLTNILYPYYYKQGKFSIIEYMDENEYFFHNFGDSKFFMHTPLNLAIVLQFCSYDDATILSFFYQWHIETYGNMWQNSDAMHRTDIKIV